MKIFKNSETTPNRNSNIYIVLIGLLISYFPSYIHRIFNLFGISIGPEGPPSVIIWNWLAVIGVLVYVIIVEKRTMKSILLTKPKLQDIKLAWYFWGIAMIWYWVINMIAPQPPSEGIDTIINLPIPVILGIVLTTAITEEILFRGYPIERMKELTGSQWIAVAISFTIFVFPHVQFMGFQWIIYHGIGTVLIYILYIWRRNLLACMFLHLLLNLPILIPALGLA
jgi:membrane protease YdiL (CAAX protease family)